MVVWGVASAAFVLWAIAAYFWHRDWSRNTRQARREKINQEVHEMWGTPEELAQRMAAEPDNPAVAIKHAYLAVGDWPELAARGEAIAKRFPKVVHGHIMVIRARWQMGEKARARTLLRRARRRFRGDGELLEIAIDHALSVQDWKQVARLGYEFRRTHPVYAAGYIHEITARLKLGQDAAALKALKIAEYELELHPKVLEEIYAAYDLERPPPLGAAEASVHEERQLF
jgi:hypothetical protein